MKPIKETFTKYKKGILTFFMFFLLAYLIMVGLVFLSSASHRYRLDGDDPMRFKIELYLPNGATEVHWVKDLKITHFGDAVSFANESGEKQTFSGDYKITVERAPFVEGQGEKK